MLYVVLSMLEWKENIKQWNAIALVYMASLKELLFHFSYQDDHVSHIHISESPAFSSKYQDFPKCSGKGECLILKR